MTAFDERLTLPYAKQRVATRGRHDQASGFLTVWVRWFQVSIDGECDSGGSKQTIPFGLPMNGICWLGRLNQVYISLNHRKWPYRKRIAIVKTSRYIGSTHTSRLAQMIRLILHPIFIKECFKRYAQNMRAEWEAFFYHDCITDKRLNMGYSVGGIWFPIDGKNRWILRRSSKWKQQSLHALIGAW